MSGIEKSWVILFGVAASISSAFTTAHGVSCPSGSGGALFTLSNEATGNRVLAFQRQECGTLREAGSFPTGGRGSGDGLGSQGALVLSADGRFLFAVDAGSNEVSSFVVNGTELKLVGHVSSGGERPISLTNRDDLLYLLNAGGDGNITAFLVDDEGGLTELAGSTRSLSGAKVGPAQIQFSPDGDNLIVSEKATNLIDIYNLGEDGRADGPGVVASNGETPFGFDFGRGGVLVVSEAFGGAKGAGAVSSYKLADDKLSVVSPSSPAGESAPCWVNVTSDGRTAFVSNTASGTISAYHVDRHGNLELINSVAASTGDGSAPIDMALSRRSRFLYALDSGTAEISAFQVVSGGILEKLPGVGKLPPNAVGLAAR